MLKIVALKKNIFSHYFQKFTVYKPSTFLRFILWGSQLREAVGAKQYLEYKTVSSKIITQESSGL